MAWLGMSRDGTDTVQWLWVSRVVIIVAVVVVVVAVSCLFALRPTSSAHLRKFHTKYLAQPTVQREAEGGVEECKP